jgi:hypothetical protein
MLTRGLEPLKATGMKKRGRLRNACKSDAARSAIQMRLSFIQILKRFSMNERTKCTVKKRTTVIHRFYPLVEKNGRTQ